MRFVNKNQKLKTLVEATRSIIVPEPLLLNIIITPISLYCYCYYYYYITTIILLLKYWGVCTFKTISNHIKIIGLKSKLQKLPLYIMQYNIKM